MMKSNDNRPSAGYVPPGTMRGGKPVFIPPAPVLNDSPSIQPRPPGKLQTALSDSICGRWSRGELVRPPGNLI